MTDTPASDVRVPAEWEPQSAIWLAWPHNRETWPGGFAAIPEFFQKWVRLIAESTPVRIVATGDELSQARRSIGDLSNVEFVPVATNDCWIRDYGPTFVKRTSLCKVEGVDWRYNAWGGKYPPWDRDQAVAAQICEAIGAACQRSELTLEGGAIETDGRGRVLTTPSCLLNQNRNPGWSDQQVAQELHRCLGVDEIVWIDGGGLVGDDTDGHIDQLARFVDCEHVVAAVCDDKNDPNYEPLQQNFRQLVLWGDSTSPKVQVHRLPIPPERRIDGQRVPESYCNFLRLGSDRLMVPTFAAPTDQHAIGLLSELTGAEVSGIDCRDLVWGLGALHCASRDEPK